MHSKISLTNNLLSRPKNHTTVLNCGTPDCTNRSNTHPFSQTPKHIKKRNEGLVDSKNESKITSKRIIYLVRPL